MVARRRQVSANWAAAVRTRTQQAVLGAMLAFGGCAHVWQPRSVLPGATALVREQLVIHCDSPLPTHHRLFEDLAAQRAQVAARLALPTSDEPIHVYLFETEREFHAFMGLH